MTTSERCSKSADILGSIARCSQKAICVEDGKPYCLIHAPSKIAERQAAWQAKQRAANNAQYEKARNKARQEAENKRKLAVYDELLAALEMLKAHADLFGAFRDDVSLGQTVLDEVNAALAKAQGQGEKL